MRKVGGSTPPLATLGTAALTQVIVAFLTLKSITALSVVDRHSPRLAVRCCTGLHGRGHARPLGSGLVGRNRVASVQWMISSGDTAGLPSDLPKAEFAFPGPLRDQLVASILAGRKTSTTGLLVDYERGDALPAVGARSLLVDSLDRPVAILEVTAVDVVPLSEVGLDHVQEEGEGHRTVAEWRAGHEQFWHSEQMRDELGDPGFTVTDATLVVLERFHVVEHRASAT